MTPARYGVLAVPTTLLFAGGEVRETLVGAHRRKRYEQAVAGLL
jgi:hypothetical protein